MKKILSVLLALTLAFALVACGTTPAPDSGGTASAGTETAAPTAAPTQAPATTDPGDSTPAAPAEHFPGKIAIVTNDVTQNEEEYRSAEALQVKYGSDKIIHRVWPVRFSEEGEQMITILQSIAADPDVKAVIINQAVINSNAAVDKLKEVRPEVFVVYSHPAENPPDVVRRANLSLNTNDPLRGETIIMTAKAMGAKVFAHYSFPRHMAVPTLSMRRDIMRETCEREGIQFVDLTAPDPMSDVGIPGAQQFILEDVPKQVAELGKDTAFFSTNCAMQIPLVIKVVDEGAMYPEPCCPSPYHAFPSALGIADKIFDGTDMMVNEDGDTVDAGRLRSVSEIVDEIRSVLASRGATGRLGTWPAPTSMMFTVVGFEYAAAWLRGEAPQDGTIDTDLIIKLCGDYTEEVTGQRLGIELNPLSLNGRVYPTYIMGILDSLVF